MGLKGFYAGLTAAGLSFFLIINIPATSYAQKAETGAVYYYLDILNKPKAYTNWGKGASGRAGQLMEAIEMLFNALSEDIIAINQAVDSNLMPDLKVRTHAKNCIKAIELNAAELKKLPPSAVEEAFKKHPSGKCKFFLRNLKTGISIKEAFLKTTPLLSEPGTYARMGHLYDFASGKTVYADVIVNDAFLKRQTVNLSFNDLVHALDNSSSAVARLTKRLNALGVNDRRVYAAVLLELSDRAAYAEHIRINAARKLSEYTTRLEEVNSKIYLNPADDLLIREKNILTNKKSFYAKTARGVGGMLSIAVLFAGAYMASADPECGKASASHYSDFIEYQRAVLNIIETAPALLPGVYSAADARAKKLISQLAYKDDAAARLIFQTANDFTARLNSLNDAQLKQLSAKNKI